MICDGLGAKKEKNKPKKKNKKKTKKQRGNL
jgi:hypothetical protein